MLSLLGIFDKKSIPDLMKNKFIAIQHESEKTLFLNLDNKTILIPEIVRMICVNDLPIQILNHNIKDITSGILHDIFLVISKHKGDVDGLIGPDTAWKFILEKTQK